VSKLLHHLTSLATVASAEVRTATAEVLNYVAGIIAYYKKLSGPEVSRYLRLVV